MLVALLHLLAQALSFLAVVGLGLTGVLLLPWSEAEQRTTSAALRTTQRLAWHLLRQGPAIALRRASSSVEVLAVRHTQP